MGSQPSQQQLKFDNDAWGLSEPAVPVKQPASRVEIVGIFESPFLIHKNKTLE